MLLREVRVIEPYLHRVGRKEAGQAWNEVADALNQCEGFILMPRDQRSVRERFNKLMADFKSRMRKEEAESGTSIEPLDEIGVLLQEITEILASLKVEEGVNKESHKKEREKALAVRDMAMRTWAKRTVLEDSEGDEDDNEAACAKPKGGRGRKRRHGGDALQYLEVKSTADTELKREELAVRKQQLELQQRQAEQQQQRQEHLQLQMMNQQQQLQQQIDQQQRQFTQQMQAQTQTQNLILALIQKMSGN